MKESSVWQYIRKGLIGCEIHLTRIESSAGNGIPDVSFAISGINGFIELKYIKEWPKRDTTKIKLPLRPEQRHWIKARMRLSGEIWVIVRIEDYFWLLDGNCAVHAAENGWTKQEWLEEQHWHKRIDFKELLELLKGD